jgi:hypothetical protein
LSFGSFGVDDHGIEDKVFVALFQKGINYHSDFINHRNELISDLLKTDKLGILLVVSHNRGIGIYVTEFFG